VLIAVQRQVGNVDQQIAEPVPGDHHADDERGALPTAPRAQRAPGDERHDAPPERRGERMRVGHVVEIERIGGGEPRCQLHLLDAAQDQPGPHDVDQLTRDEQRAEGQALIDRLRGERRAVMTDHHRGDDTRHSHQRAS